MRLRKGTRYDVSVKFSVHQRIICLDMRLEISATSLSMPSQRSALLQAFVSVLVLAF